MRTFARDAVVILLLLAATSVAGQTPTYRAPRTADGKPDLNGIWQALNSANWDLEGHAAGMGPAPMLGALFAKPPGQGVVEGDTIPYLPAAMAKKRENQANWVALDPEAKCYLPGVPRATYLPRPFQIVQSQNVVMTVPRRLGARRRRTGGWGEAMSVGGPAEAALARLRTRRPQSDDDSLPPVGFPAAFRGYR